MRNPECTYSLKGTQELIFDIWKEEEITELPGEESRVFIVTKLIEMWEEKNKNKTITGQEIPWLEGGTP